MERRSSERVSADFVDAFQKPLVKRTTSSWKFGLGVLQRFKEPKGDVLGGKKDDYTKRAGTDTAGVRHFEDSKNRTFGSITPALPPIRQPPESSLRFRTLRLSDFHRLKKGQREVKPRGRPLRPSSMPSFFHAIPGKAQRTRQRTVSHVPNRRPSPAWEDSHSSSGAWQSRAEEDKRCLLSFRMTSDVSVL